VVLFGHESELVVVYFFDVVDEVVAIGSKGI